MHLKPLPAPVTVKTDASAKGSVRLFLGPGPVQDGPTRRTHSKETKTEKEQIKSFKILDSISMARHTSEFINEEHLISHSRKPQSVCHQHLCVTVSQKRDSLTNRKIVLGLVDLNCLDCILYS